MPHREVPALEVHALTDTGQVRTDNQDAIRSCHPGVEQTARLGHLFALADGMGGFAHGGVASTLALEILFKTYYASEGSSPLQRLRKGVQDANIGVHQAATAKGVGRMGTTLTAVHLQGHSLNVAHVGDSRAYLIRDGVATCLTNDHTRVGELVRMRMLSPDKVRTHAHRSVLNRCLGLELFVQPDLFTVPVREDDLIVLCSDGIWGYVEDEDFAEFASGEQGLENYNKRLLEEALHRGSDDNLSVLSLKLKALAAPLPGEGTPLGAFFRRVFRR